jgi:uncharacterized protein YodC (DUF2158 family)
MPTMQLHAKRQDGTTKWYHWYSSSDTKEERKLVFKLDMLIIVYSVVAYWIKYIDQSNLSMWHHESKELITDAMNSKCLCRWYEGRSGV